MSEFGTLGHIFFPRQKLPTTKKNDAWLKQNIEAAKSLLLNRDISGLDKIEEMDSDIKMYEGKVDSSEYEDLFNPMKIEGEVFPDSVKNYPIASPKIDLLMGEEYLREDEFYVRTTSESAISEKQQAQMDMVMELVQQEIMEDSSSEEEMQHKIQKLGRYMKYSWKDAKELTATRLIQHIYKHQNLKKKFNEGMLSLLSSSREIYRIDEVAGDVVVELVDPRKVFIFGHRDNFNVEDADIIVEVDYVPAGKVIDEFYEHLSQSDINKIEGACSKDSDSDKGVLSYATLNPKLYYPIVDQEGTESLIDVSDSVTDMGYLSPVDKNGNIRVCRVRWRGRRPISKVTYIDEFGDEQFRWASERYQADQELGEKVQKVWVNEAYEGTEILDGIFVKMGPRKVQVRGKNNKSKCDLGYIGTDCGISLARRMRPFQFAYNIYMRRLELLCARYGGPVIEVDMSKIPAEWDLDKWMYYLHILGYMMTDPFNEGTKGASTGKLAGNLNTTNRAISPEIGNMIQQYIGMLGYIEQQLGTIAGVTKQREGQVDNRETVGGVERAVTQSSHITEKWFIIHQDIKERVLQAVLDISKQVFRGDNKKLEIITDDMSRTMLNVDWDNIRYEDLDLFISSDSEDLRLRQTLENIAQTMVQNGARSSVLLQSLKSKSIAERTHILEEEEDRREALEQEAREAEQETRQMETEAKMESEEKERELKRYEIDMKYQIALLQAMSRQETELSKLDQDLSLKLRQHEDKMEANRAKQAEASRHNREMEQAKKQKQ